MANIKVLGNAAVITSAAKLADIKLLEKYRPAALTLLGGEDGKQPIFRVMTACGDGSLDCNGAVFCNTTRDAEGYAQITVKVSGECADLQEQLADVFGAGLLNLKKIEEAIPAAVEEVKAEKEAILAQISIA